MKKIKKVSVGAFLLVLNFVMISGVYAASGTKTYEKKLTNPLSVETPLELIGKIIQFLMAGIGAIAVLFIVYAGFKYMTAGGNEKKIEEAKKALTGAIIGLAIALLAYSITSFVINMLKS